MKKLLIPVLLLVFLLASCSSCRNKSAYTVRNLTFETDSVEAVVGDTIRVSLDYPPVGGTEWNLNAFDKEICSLLDSKSNVKIENSELLRNVWRFLCLKPGNTTIEFGLQKMGGRTGLQENSKVIRVSIKK